MSLQAAASPGHLLCASGQARALASAEGPFRDTACPLRSGPRPLAAGFRTLRHFFSALSRIFENEDFVKSLTALTKKARCKLTVYPLEESMEDQWMQVRGLMG